MRTALLTLALVLALPVCAARHTVSAYCHRSRTALGTRPRIGTCAGPRQYLGRYVRIAGYRYRVEDICARGFDIWLPTRQACRKFGRHTMEVQIGGRFARRH